jgi:26S proteasome regulatory subunit N1
MQGISIELDEEMTDNEEQRELLQELISNSKLSEGYLTLARDLDVMEPKTPDDLYKVKIVFDILFCLLLSEN